MTLKQDMTDTIAIVDLGGQYCHMISRRLRDLGVWSDIVPANSVASTLADYSGIILSGGPQSVYDDDAPRIDLNVLNLDRPVLGICYGHQLLAQALGATISPGDEEFGPSDLHLREKDTIFSGTPAQQRVWMSHSDAVSDLPKDATLLATTDRCEVAAFHDVDRRLFGVQFHPEASHTQYGSQVLSNFALKICKIKADDAADDQVERLTDQIRQRVGEKSVFFLVSGGVDSTVAFALCARALPAERVLGVYVDTGLMRQGETAELRALLSNLGIANRLEIRDESQRFLTALAGKTDPEEKRAIIGRLFIDVQSEACREYGIDADNWLIGQGTIYPDTIESGGTAASAVIKTHHNRCGEMVELIRQGRVIEPISEFYKDEVRQIGSALGLSDQLTQRWPFPGPGLAIRVLCTKDDAGGSARPAVLPERFSYEAVSLPIRSVGVQGDGRTYREVVAIKGALKYDELEELSSHLCNIGKAHNRVILHLAGDTGLASARVLPGRTITEQRLEILRQADFTVRETMKAAGMTGAVWQFPVVMIPVNFGDGENDSIVLRPVDSEDGMTANFSRLPADLLSALARKIADLPGVSAVFLDVSDKPPATIEWE